MAIRLRKFSIFSIFLKFSKTVKNSLNISGRHIILENVGKLKELSYFIEKFQ
jgi:hypothetical protein